MEQTTTNNTEGMLDKVMNKKVREKLEGWNWFAIIISVILFVLMCIKAELYSELWQDELYSSLGIIVPIAGILPIIGKVILVKGRIEKVKVVVQWIHLLAGICAFIGYVVIRINSGGHETDPEFYARRFFAIWFMVDFISGVFMQRAINADI